MEHRTGILGPGALIPIPPAPFPPPVPREIPVPIPQICAELRSDVGSESDRVLTRLVRCFWCDRVHAGQHLLSVCNSCAAGYSTMRTLEMSGTYPLTEGAIERALTRTSPGNYALGYMDEGSFSVFYVGRSDSDVKRRLHDWVGMPSQFDRYASYARASWGVQHRGPAVLGAPALGRVGNADAPYTSFAFSYAASVEEAYAKEWRNFDAFGGSDGLDNETPPVSSAVG